MEAFLIHGITTAHFGEKLAGDAIAVTTTIEGANEEIERIIRDCDAPEIEIMETHILHSFECRKYNTGHCFNIERVRLLDGIPEGGEEVGRQSRKYCDVHIRLVWYIYENVHHIVETRNGVVRARHMYDDWDNAEDCFESWILT